MAEAVRSRYYAASFHPIQIRRTVDFKLEVAPSGRRNTRLFPKRKVNRNEHGSCDMGSSGEAHLATRVACPRCAARGKARLPSSPRLASPHLGKRLAAATAPDPARESYRPSLER